MKKTLLGLFAVLVPFFQVLGQTAVVAPVICSDPASGIYIVDPSASVNLYIEDAGGVKQSVTWSPITDLYTDPAMTTPYVAGTPVTDVYFGGADPYQSYTYSAADATTGTVLSTLVLATGGITHQLCAGNADTLADIDVLGIPAANLTWYDDPLGTNTLPDTTPVQDNTTYYVDMGIAGCTEIFPVVVTNVSVSLTPALCFDPVNNIYIVDPTADVQITIQDAMGNNQSAIWTPTDYLYMFANQGFQYPGAPFPDDEIYFNGNDYQEVGDANGNGIFNELTPGPEPHQTLTYQAQYTIPGCSPETTTLQIVLGGFTYDDLCFKEQKPLSDIDILNIPDNELTWYDDAAGTNAIPNTTIMLPETTYYVDLGPSFGSCGMVFPVDIEYTVPRPTSDLAPQFCSTATWSALGINETGATLGDLSLCGEPGASFTFFSDATGTTIIPNPNSIPLVDGTSYYVSQTVGGCESALLEIIPDERECACYKNQNLEDISLSGYDVFYKPTVHISGGVCTETGASINTPGTIGSLNDPTDTDAAPVSAIDDPYLAGYGVSLSQTSPLGGCSEYGMRLNSARDGAIGNGPYNDRTVKLVRDFIAGEVFAFDFAVILRNPNHPPDSQPFLKVLILDENNNVVQERCIISDPQGCVFYDAGINDGNGQVLYSTWSNLKLNTIEIQGQPAKAVFIISDCGDTVHFGYAYIDNIFVGDESDAPNYGSSFGYMALESIDNTGSDGYEACSLVQPPMDPACAPALSVLNPQFPMQICGYYENPISTQGDAINLQTISLDVVHNGSVVATLTSAGPGNDPNNPDDFCFTLNQGDIGTPPFYGQYTFEAKIQYQVQCSGGVPIDVEAQSNGFKFCPTAGCPPAQSFCQGSGGQQTVDLTDPAITSAVLDGAIAADHVITYYFTDAGAQTADPNDLVPTPSNFQTATTITLYIRLEYDYAALGISPIQDCYDVVPLDIIIGAEPNVPASLPTPIGSIGCVDASGNGNFDLTQAYAGVTANITNPGTTVVVTYHATLQDAQLGIPEITNSTNYPGSNGQTIYVRTENLSDGCFAITSFSLQGNQLAYNIPVTLVLCDQDADTQDGSTAVDLSVATAQITQGFPNLSLTYHVLQADAQAGTGAIATPTAFTTSDATIYVRIEDANDPVCFKVEPLAIDVVPSPEAFPASMSLCDLDNGGDEAFDLSSLDTTVNNGAGGVTVTYHATQADADAGTPALPIPFTSGTATIFARVDNGTCFKTSQVDLILEPSPNVELAANIAPYQLCDDGDGVVEFDLTTMKDPVIADPNLANFTMAYYASLADLNGNTPIPAADEATYENTSPTQTIYVVVTGTNGCTAQTSFDITVNPLPTFNAPSPLVECDQGTQDGITQFTLTDAENDIKANDPSLVVVFYETLAEAQTGTGTPLATPYTNIVATNHTIYAQVTDPATGCSTTTPVSLEAIPAPTVTAPPPYEICDGDDGAIDGQAVFALSSLDATITGGTAGVLVSYHATQADAAAGNPDLPLNYASPTATIYARVEETSGAGCYNTVAVPLAVLQNPVLPTSIPSLKECDPEGDGTESFDLTQNQATLTTNEPAPGDWTVAYYASVVDRNNDIPVADATAYVNTSSPVQTIYVRVTGANGCASDAQFDLVVNPLPGVNTPEPLIICDDGTSPGYAFFDLNNATLQVTGGNSNLSASYYETQAEAEAGVPGTEIQNTANYQNQVAGNDTIYIRIEDNTTGCVVVLPLPLQVNAAPVANVPQPYVYCDPDNDGFGLFDLPSLDLEITGGVAGVTVTYHETLANAQNDVLDIATPNAFANTVQGTQTIYARVEAPGVDCFVIVQVVLVVEPSPQPVLPQDLPALNGCDDDGDGIVIFDLNPMEALIEANEANPADFTVAYYASLADIPANPISVPAAYASATATIYVVVTGPNGCTKQTSFELVVNALPAITTPQPLELCDVNNPGDQTEVFDLTLATLDISMGDPSIDISYYQTQAAADLGDPNSPDYIANPTGYPNLVNNQTIYIRAVDTDTGCTVTQGYTLTLIVNPLPSPEIPAEPLEACDADNDGFVEFDLAAQIPIIQNGEPDVSISFHFSLQDAESGTGAIDTSVPFGLTSGNAQTLYVRAENNFTGCYVTAPLVLVVVPTPEIASLEDLYICDDSSPNGLAIFDLTQNTPNILGTQDPNQVLITFHTSQQDAQDGANPIVVPSSYTNTSNGQYIYVRIEDIATGCFDTFDFADDNSFQLFVEELPVVNDPTPLMVCDDDYGTEPVEQAIFDLTAKEGEIAGQPFPPNDYQFTYYASQQDLDNGTPIQNPTAYQNTDNPQVIFITVTNGDTQNLCQDQTTLTITVLQLPSPSQDDQEVLRLVECDDDNDGVAANPFDLTQSGNLIAGGENVVLTYWKTQAAAQAGDTTSPEYIANPAAYVNEPPYNTVNGQGVQVQVIYVRVESGVAGNACYVTTQFEIVVVPAPVLNPIAPFGYTLCEDGSTGTGTLFQQDIAYNLYDASTANPDPSALVPLLDQNENSDLNLDNYELHYYESLNPDVPLASGYVASTGDIIYVRVEHRDTGCFSGTGEILVTVEPRPAIVAVNITEHFCSDGPGGSTATVDLTQYDGMINPGAPANTQVTYYADMQAYLNGMPIENPAAYTTTDNPQTIVAVVRDTENLCASANHAQITIVVEAGPLVDISGYSGVICEDLDPTTQVVGGDYSPSSIETGLDESLYSFEWALDGNILPEDGPSLVVTQPGTYQVTVTDNASQCAITSTAVFSAGNPPEFDVDPLTSAFDGKHALFISGVTGIGNYQFSVDNGPWQALGGDGTLTIDGIAPGAHFVYGRDSQGCGTTVVPINFIDYPKFFTPNADGYNDTWNVLGLGQENAAAKIYVFDRYGKLLKQLSPSGPGWDGTYNGNPMPADDYWFRVEYFQEMPDGSFMQRMFKANFSLVR